MAGPRVDLLVLLCAAQTMAPVSSKTMKRVLVVPWSMAPMGLHGVFPCNLLLRGDEPRRLRRKIGVDPLRRAGGHVQPELRAAPQDIPGAPRPFAAHEVIDFRCREPAPKSSPRSPMDRAPFRDSSARVP